MHPSCRCRLVPCLLATPLPAARCRDALRSCASLDALIAALRRPLRLDEALDVELWMLDPGGACLLVGPTLPPAAVLEAAAGLVLDVRL